MQSISYDCTVIITSSVSIEGNTDELFQPVEQLLTMGAFDRQLRFITFKLVCEFPLSGLFTYELALYNYYSFFSCIS